MLSEEPKMISAGELVFAIGRVQDNGDVTLKGIKIDALNGIKIDAPA